VGITAIDTLLIGFNSSSFEAVMGT
jgi:hypothetical protein